MELPLASAKTTSAVMKHFMAGLGVWPEWQLEHCHSRRPRKKLHTVHDFQGDLDRSPRRPPRYRIGAGRCYSATVTTMVVMALIGRDAGNRRTDRPCK